jgi:hypothetical protein
LNPGRSRLPDWPASTLVQGVLVLSALEGIAAVFLTAVRASDVDSRTWGPYSADRWALIGVLAALSLGSCLLAFTSIRGDRLRSRLSRLLYDQPSTVPRILGFILLGLIALLVGLMLFVPQVMASLNEARLVRLLPAILWAIAWVVQWALAWVLLFHKEWLLPPAATMDAVALLAIGAIALAVRVPATSFGLPYEAMWDEVVTYPRSLQSLVVSGNPAPETVPGYGSAGYGDILEGITTASSVIGLLDSFRTQAVTSISEYVSPPAGVNAVTQAVHHSGNPLRYPRLAFALLNSLAPLLIFIILRRQLALPWLPAGAGATAYALLSADVVSASSFILPDSLAATLMLASLLFALEGTLVTKESLVPWVLSGLLAGLAASTSLRSVLIPTLPFALLLMTTRRSRLLGQIVLLTAGVVIGYLAASPSLLFNLPSFLSRATDLTWLQDSSLQHRTDSLAFYAQALLGPSSGGYSLAILGLAIAGLYRSATRFPFVLGALGAFVAAHLYLVTPIVQRYPRHVLILSPLICILAGIGLAAVSDWLQGRLANTVRPSFQAQRAIVPGVLFVILVLASSPQIRKTLMTVDRLHSFVPSQVQVARYLDDMMADGEVVGLQQELPFVERDLTSRGLAYVRIASDVTPAEIHRRGIDLVVGTSRLHGQYAVPPAGLWQGAFEDPSTRLAEFGEDDLEFDGWPAANLFMFVARVPGR